MSDTVDIQEEITACEAASGDKTITPEHRAWMNAETQKTMDKKARGETNYTPLEAVRKEFGF